MNPCKICHSSTTSLKDKKQGQVYYRCSSCGFVYLDDSFIVDAKREKFQYDQHNNGFNDTGYVQMFENFIQNSIEEFLPSIKTALDFGSGPGPVLSELLKQKGLEVDIYDLYYSPKKVYQNKSYDLITSTEVFEHLSKPLEVMQTLVSHLNPNSYLAIMTKFPPKDDEEFLNWWYRRDPTHISFYTPKTFEVLAKKFGLEIVKFVGDNVVVFKKTNPS